MSKFKVGDLVQSCYAARWYGVILHVEARRGIGSLVTIQVTHDAKGNRQRKTFVKRLDEHWLRAV